MGRDKDTRGQTEHVPAAWTLRAVVETHENSPNQCTIYPKETAGIERMSTWITARGESFIALDEMR